MPDAPKTPSDVSRLLRSLDLSPSRGKGQNFLVDESVADNIVASLSTDPDQVVVEIGPGLGALTSRLAETHDRVVAVEFDSILAAHLQSAFASSSVEAIEGDGLTIPVDSIVDPDDRYVVVANLPYSVGTAIIRRFLEEPHAPDKMIVMVQREVAERMAADVPDMSVLGIATQLYSAPHIRFHVSPDAFKPRPKVESTVVELIRRPQVQVEPGDREAFFELVHAGFAQKRKTVENSLSRTLGEPKSDIADQLRTAGIDPMARAQRLSLDDWVRLFEVRHQPGT